MHLPTLLRGKDLVGSSNDRRTNSTCLTPSLHFVECVYVDWNWIGSLFMPICFRSISFSGCSSVRRDIFRILSAPNIRCGRSFYRKASLPFFRNYDTIILICRVPRTLRVNLQQLQIWSGLTRSRHGSTHQI